MSSTSISPSDSAILNAQEKTGPRGMGVGIVRGDYWGDVGLDLGFRAEKRSAQASAHPLSQAQGGLFCALTVALTVFICCWSSE